MNIQTPVSTNYGGWLAQHGAHWKALTEKLASRHADWQLEFRVPGEHLTEVPVVYCPRAKIIDLLRELRAEEGYVFLSDLTATDESEGGFTHRFELVYQLYAPKRDRIRVKVRLAENESAPTATVLWPAANWAEREVWDMFGIRFDGHPDLRRILMDERWVGHPLRKDYPLRGYQVFTEPMQAQPELLD
jgi:NADH/F420H2 dehydrogenase subunit C